MEELRKKREREQKRLVHINSDPDLRAKEKEKNHVKYLKKKEKGTVKNVADLPPRKQRQKRKEWKQNSKKYRERNKEKTKERTENVIEELPNNSLVEDVITITKDLPRTPTTLELGECSGNNSASRVEMGRRIVRRNRSILSKRFASITEKLAKKNKECDRLRKKFQRFEQKTLKSTHLTPNSKIRKLVKKHNIPQHIRRKLVLGEGLATQLQENYRRLKTNKDKQIFTRLCSGGVIKKYRLQSQCPGFLKARQIAALKGLTQNSTRYQRKIATSALSDTLRNSIVSFFQDDACSRVCPGKKDCITKSKFKKQKRFLNETVGNLYKKYCKEHPTSTVSFYSFARLRPFWVIKPQVTARDTCRCTVHANMEMLVNRVHELKIIEEKSPLNVMESICCNKNTVACLQRKCNICKKLKKY